MTTKITGQLPNIEEYQEFSFPCLRVSQPIGDFYIASMPSKILCDITYFDVRRIMSEEREFESYLGIQRPVEKKRVAALQKYVLTEDATFPTSIIIAVSGDCARYDEASSTLTLSNLVDVAEDQNPIYVPNIAKVLDGQHRIEGLKASPEGRFSVNVSIFVDVDIATQAQIFSTVNLEQTKVNKSIVYDLFALATHRSPQKTSHLIAVALDKERDSPFYQRIKRLGATTRNRFNETLTQATFVEALLPYISENPKDDRNLYLKNLKPAQLDADKLQKIPFGNLFIAERDFEITDVLWNYFGAVRERWPTAWNATGTGYMLNRTNGFRALMRFLRPTYLRLTAPGGVPTMEQFLGEFQKIGIDDQDFVIDVFKPGTGGESALYHALLQRGLPRSEPYSK